MSAQICMAGADSSCRGQIFADLVPVGARLYVSHVAAGKSLRAVGKDHGCHASTVLRQVRHFENRRDDPLVDDALRRMDHALRKTSMTVPEWGGLSMTTHTSGREFVSAGPKFEQEAMLNLQHLLHASSLLLVAPDMLMAVVTRKDKDGEHRQVSVMDRSIAEVMALNDWISCRSQGRVTRYAINDSGRSALRRYCAKQGIAFAPFGMAEHSPAGRIRYGGTESPITVLARRRDKNGQPFLDACLVRAATRLREDFVMAQLDSVTLDMVQDFVDALENRTVPGPNIAPPGTKAAGQRVLEVLRDLGPGLGDIVLRCCCRLEGVESAEQAMGWSARSGKIVLRIALQRMTHHYQRMGDEQMMIG
jgi:hypothetical protein